MAHFAEISEDRIVLRVLVVPYSEEHRVDEFLSQDLGLGGNWIQCSYNGNIRKQFPGIGSRYDSVQDIFIAVQPYPSWTLDANSDWQPPVPMPVDGVAYTWNEDTLTWDVFNPAN